MDAKKTGIVLHPIPTSLLAGVFFFEWNFERREMRVSRKGRLMAVIPDVSPGQWNDFFHSKTARRD